MKFRHQFYWNLNFFSTVYRGETNYRPLGLSQQNVLTGVEQIFSFFFFIFLWSFYYITVLQCELPALRSHCGEAPGRDSNPGRAI